MATEKAVFVGPRLRRLRRDLGLTQTAMAEDLGISPSYIALIERNQRPLTAQVLLKLASIYKVDLSEFTAEGGVNLTRRLKKVLTDPLFNELDLGPSEHEELALSHPGIAEALIRAHRAYQDGQLALADRRGRDRVWDPLEETRNVLSRNHNYFHDIDQKAERIGRDHQGFDKLAAYMDARLSHRVRFMPPDVMGTSVRQLHPHKNELVLDTSLSQSAATFQLALQIVYLSFTQAIETVLDAAATDDEGDANQPLSDEARNITRRALANYAAGAVIMPYNAFYEAAEACRYDVESLARQFGVSFEQAAHRLTTLQRKDAAGVPFFFIRVDPAGNVSKRLDGADFPFAKHGGSCPLWTLHAAFKRPGDILTQSLELPDGQKFFSIARTVMAGGGGHTAPRAERAIALGCAIDHAPRLIYADDHDLDRVAPTPIGVACSLCHRADCIARSEPPLGRTLLPDDNRRMRAPFLFGDEG